MSEPLLRALAICAHLLMTAALLWLIGSMDWALALRIVAAALTAAILLPAVQILAARRYDRLGWLALALVLIIGIGIVEVLATGAHWRATTLLGAAMLEFAATFSLSRGRSQPATHESTQR